MKFIINILKKNSHWFYRLSRVCRSNPTYELSQICGLNQTGRLSQKLKCGLVCSFSLAIPFLFISCTTFDEAPQKSNLTTGVVKTQIQKGVTSQAQVLQLLGSPNIITKDKQGQEIWTYSKQSFKSESNAMGGSLILFSSASAFSAASSSTFDLIIIFNKQDIVKDYSVVSSQF